MCSRLLQAPKACYLLSVRTGPQSAWVQSQQTPLQCQRKPRCWSPPPPNGMVFIFRRVGAYSPAQPVFRLTPFLQAHEYSVYSRWWSGWMVEHWRLVFFFFCERHSFQRLTITWASRWQGILVQYIYIFYLILRVHESVDFSKSVLDRRPRSWRRPGDTWRDGAVFQEDVVKKRSKLVRLSSSALRSSGALLAGPGLCPGWLCGETISRDSRTILPIQTAVRGSYFPSFRMKWNPCFWSKWITNSQTRREDEAKHEPNIFLLLARADAIFRSVSENPKLSAAVFIIPPSSVRWCNQSLRHVCSTTGVTAPPPHPTQPPRPISGCTGETAAQPQPCSSHFPSHHFFFFSLASLLFPPHFLLWGVFI